MVILALLPKYLVATGKLAKPTGSVSCRDSITKWLSLWREQICSVLRLHSECQKMSPCTDTWDYPMGLFVTWPPRLSASNGCLGLPFPFTGSTLVKQFSPLHPWGSWNSLEDINFTSKEAFGVLTYSAVGSVLLCLGEGWGSDPGQHVFYPRVGAP